LSDHDVVARARKGDQEAFRVLVERYQGRLHALAMRVLRDPEQARDATQEAFLKAYTSLDRFEGRSSFYTWLYRLAMNLCLDLKRRDHSDRRVATPELGDLERIATVDSRPADQQHWRDHEDPPDEAVSRAELREQVSRAIASLPEASRETLILREVEGLSYTEIAEALDSPRGTVMSRLHYARRRVQEILRAAGAVDAWDVVPDSETVEDAPNPATRGDES
jgi:RNA polymerase sigma-70 factor (ECF subfamily)